MSAVVLRHGPMYCVEYAKSNRAACKGCKAKIDKDVLRIGINTPGPGDYLMTSWRHLECVKKPKPGKGLDTLDELSGLTGLSADDQAKVACWFAQGAAPAVKPQGGKKRAAEDDQAVSKLSDPKKMKIGELKEALAAAGLPTTGKKGDLVEALEPVFLRQEVEKGYASLSGDKLKVMLELNGQKKSGNKDELVERCVDGKLYGALPRCPECGSGILRVAYLSKYGHAGQGRFSCPGYFDDDAFVRCGYSATQVERAPWQEVTDAASNSTSTSSAPASKAAAKSAPKAAATPSAAAVPVPVAAVKAELPAARMPGLDE